MDAHAKLKTLQALLRSWGDLVVGFSGGVDSTFLLKVAQEALGDQVLAVTARSSTYPEREFREATALVRQLGIRHVVIISEELEIAGFADNPVNRCYFCKRELFQKVQAVAREQHFTHVADGSNVDDLGDYRPGRQALTELGILSPLRAAGLTKAEIRQLSRELGLPTWDKPAFACLSSRFPYGEKITVPKLTMIEQAEQYLLDAGFRQVRVRHHGEVARIEVAADERQRFFDTGLLDRVHAELRRLGFQYVALDLQGYRTGSMNEPLPAQARAGGQRPGKDADGAA